MSALITRNDTADAAHLESTEHASTIRFEFMGYAGPFTMDSTHVYHHVSKIPGGNQVASTPRQRG